MKNQRLKKIRVMIINILATTALSVLFMCVIGIFQGYMLWGVTIPFEILLVNFLMHLGGFLLEKIDIKFSIIKYFLMLVFVLTLIIGFGFLFNWFEVIAVWVICIVGAAVFLISVVTDALMLKRDADEINNKINKIKQREKAE